MGENARILVVDDDVEGVRKVLKAILEEEGYVIDTAENGKEAIKKSKTKFYNLALIDIRLPDMEGTKLLTAMKEATPKMVKIIITGYPSLQNAIEAVNKGANAYVLKPFYMDKLLNKVKEPFEETTRSKKIQSRKSQRFHRNTRQRTRRKNHNSQKTTLKSCSYSLF